jgi:hypothetical protein
LQLFADETQLVDKVSCETSLTLHLGPVWIVATRRTTIF